MSPRWPVACIKDDGGGLHHDHFKTVQNLRRNYSCFFITVRDPVERIESGFRYEMLQKRVTVFYRPQSPDKSAIQVQQSLTNAQFAANQKNRRPTSSQIIALEKARKAEREQAEGASLVRFSIVVTATVEAVEQLPRVAATLHGSCMNAGLNTNTWDWGCVLLGRCLGSWGG